jgi:1-deoxy-D-xylulose-5-phosphate reductoisomerase
MKAQMGLPDMRLPIQYALGFPERLESNFPRFSFADYGNLTFEKADASTFRNLELAYEAMKKGGNLPCIMNAANEVAVQAFLNEKISFLRMPDIIEAAMNRVSFIQHPDINDYNTSDKESRQVALSMM